MKIKLYVFTALACLIAANPSFAERENGNAPTGIPVITQLSSGRALERYDYLKQQEILSELQVSQILKPDASCNIEHPDLDPDCSYCEDPKNYPQFCIYSFEQNQSGIPGN